MLRYVRGLFRTKMPEDHIIQEAYHEINRSLNTAFEHPSLRAYLRTLSTSGLLIKAVEMFVGSHNIPKNKDLSNYLIGVARNKATTQHLQDEIEFCKYYMIRFTAGQQGNQADFDMTSQVMARLAERGHPQASYQIGKQIYDVAMVTSDPEQKQKMQLASVKYFEQSITPFHFEGFYYLGKIFQKNESTMPAQTIKNFYVYGAALGNPLCYFQMYTIYLSQDNPALAIKYLKMAAEQGVVEAQHNLAYCYHNGNNIQKDELKAFAWFSHAAANGFVEAKFNLVFMFLNGSECGRIKKNPEAAILRLKELRELGGEYEKRVQEILKEEKVVEILRGVEKRCDSD